MDEIISKAATLLEALDDLEHPAARPIAFGTSPGADDRA